ncbi:restriction endonuclease subunit S [Acaryochloris sp. CCMEE 5410]|nr:restriction endonuclease subunit S [Acaryochloris sp. CCMEE 5410]
MPLVPMGEVLKVEGGFAFKSKDFEENGYPVIRISNIDGATVNVENTAKIPPEKLGKAEKFRILSDDILIAMSGATTGKLGIVPDLNGYCAYLNQRVGRFSLKGNSAIDRKYLWFFLKSEICQQQIKILAEGAAQPNVSGSELESIKIPLPPIAEQKRIAGILDAADALRVKRRDAIATLDALLQSTFLTLFGDPITNPMGWDASNLEAVSEKITDGTHKTPKYTESGIEFLSAKDIKNGSIKWNTGKFISEDEHKSLITRCHPEIGDVLLAKSGSLGSVAIIDRDHEFSLFESLCLIKHNRQKIEAQFLTAMLESPRMQMHLLSRNKGISIKHLHLTDIRKLKILLPPLDKQRKFATIVASIEKQKAQQCAHLAELDTLFASLQSRAFNGEL